MALILLIMQIISAVITIAPELIAFIQKIIELIGKSHGGARMQAMADLERILHRHVHGGPLNVANLKQDLDGLHQKLSSKP